MLPPRPQASKTTPTEKKAIEEPPQEVSDFSLVIDQEQQKMNQQALKSFFNNA